VRGAHSRASTRGFSFSSDSVSFASVPQFGRTRTFALLRFRCKTQGFAPTGNVQNSGGSAISAPSRRGRQNDLSRSLIPLDLDTTLIAVVELSLSSC